jgi:hypothetical protein
MHYYNLDSKKNRRSQHEHFEKNRCGYRKFIPIKFTNNECEHPRLALEDIIDKETTGMTYKLKEICTKEDARLSGQTTTMQVEANLYYIEIVFKEGKVSKCYPRPGATPDWFCNPRKTEIEKAFEYGWSMLPFNFFGEANEEEFSSVFCTDCAFNMRVWARMDDRISKGSQNGVVDGVEGNGLMTERKFFENVVKKGCENN